MREELKVYDHKMGRTIEVLSKELGAVRAGRANPAVLDKISIDYYGAATPLAQVAAVASPDPRTLSIQPWDGSILKLVEKAIQMSDLGINPQNDGKQIRLSFPPLTEERRKDLIKQVTKTGEEAKIALRNVRREGVDKLKDLKKKNELTEDDQKTAEQELQKLTDKYVKDVDGIVAKKSKELSEV